MRLIKMVASGIILVGVPNSIFCYHCFLFSFLDRKRREERGNVDERRVMGYNVMDWKKKGWSRRASVDQS